MNKIHELVESVNRLSATDPTSCCVGDKVNEVLLKVKQIRNEDSFDSYDECCLNEAPKVIPQNLAPAGQIIDKIDSMRSSAARPASNYSRMVSILDGLRHAAMLSQRPQNASVRPKIAAIVNKVAGIFSQVDTVKDLDKPLEQIEKAVHSLYGNQSLNGTYYFDRRGKGHNPNTYE